MPVARRGGLPEKCQLAFALFGLIFIRGKGRSKGERESGGERERSEERRNKALQ